MRSVYLLLSVAILALSVVVFAASFSTTPSSQNATTSAINQTFSVTITNNNVSANITRANFTLPAGMVFVVGSNFTNASSTTFSSSASTANWTNSTPGGIINGSASAWFFFKANVSLIFNVTNITITTMDTSGVQNTTNYTVSVAPPTDSNGGEFGTVQTTTYLNWTNAYQQNITIIANGTRNTNITLEMINATAAFIGNYSVQLTCGYLATQNLTGYGNVTGPINGSSGYNTANITVIANATSCSPGRYWIQQLTIRDQTNNGENLSVAVFVDVPLNTSNTNLTTGATNFNGSLPANATTYQSYYFNTSAVPNATSVYVNLSATNIAHLFLFDGSGSMKAESVSGGATQSLGYNYPPSVSAVWEIRVYGNSTSPINYSGVVVFSTLNVTNSSLTYGNLNASGSIGTTNLNLTNQGGLAIGNISLSSSLYRVQSFNGTGDRSFAFLVGDPGTESGVRVNLTWTGASNYTLNVYDPAGTLVMTSGNAYTLANVSNAGILELYNDTATITNPGYWNASVVNNSGNDPFNVTVFTFENTTNWMNTSVSTTPSLNNLSSNTSVQVNLTVPTQAIDGGYQGNLTFTDENGGRVNVPIVFNVTTPTLLVLNASNTPNLLNPFNASGSSNVFRIDEDYGATLTRNITINLTNIGTFNSSINMALNSTNLTCTSSLCSGFFANMTYNTTSNVTSHGFALIQINVSYNSSFPVGTYDGWIFINATNSSANLSSHPYASYNLTVRLNLTNSMNINIFNITSAGGTSVLNGTTGGNMTVALYTSYMNDTNETGITSASNFTSVWLQEGNVSNILSNSAGRIPLQGSLSGITNDTSPMYAGGYYNLNATLPPNTPGGQYVMYITSIFNRNDNFNFTGSGSTFPVVVNNTGLYFTPISTATNTISNGTGPGTYYTANVTVQNFGPMNASAAQVTISKNASYTTISQALSNCDGWSTGAASTSSVVVTFNLSAYNSSGCYIAWNVTAGPSAGTDTIRINGTVGTWFNNISAFNIMVNVTSPASQPPGVSSGPSTPTVTTGDKTATVAINMTEGDNQVPIGYVAGLYISSLVVNTNDNVNNVQIVIDTLTSKPSDITQNVNGPIFNYFEIVPTIISDTDVNNVTINFYVEKNWLGSSINDSTVTLYRYSGGAWNALPTNKTSEGTDYVYYSAVSPGLSTYAIAGQANTATPVNTTANVTSQVNVTGRGVTPTTPTQQLPLVSIIGFVLIAAGVAGLAIYLMSGGRKKAKNGMQRTGKWDELRKKWQ